MEILNVIAAAVASYIFGAVWYSVLAKQWMAAAGVAANPETGRPANASQAGPYILAFAASLLVAGMMRHVLTTSGVDTLGEAALSGFGIGAFIATPWIATNYGFAGRPVRLMLIDGGYATIGCTIMGIVLTVF